MKHPHLLLLFLIGAFAPLCAGENFVTNPGFESNSSKADGWSAIWSRAAGSATASVDASVHHSGDRALKIVNSGDTDWSIAQTRTITVQSGDIFSIEGWVKHEGSGRSDLSVVTRRANGEVIQWTHGLIESAGSHDWLQLKRKFAIGEGCATIQLRWTGQGALTAWLDDVMLERSGKLADLDNAHQGKPVVLQNARMGVTIKQGGALEVSLAGPAPVLYAQHPGGDNSIAVESVYKENELQATLQLVELAHDFPFTARVSLEKDAPIIHVRIDALGLLAGTLAYPPPFWNAPTASLAIPMNEGISYPCNDQSIHAMRLITYGGHGISMPWFGAYDPSSGAGAMGLIRTPDDAMIDISRSGNSGLYVHPLWQSSRGNFSYPREIDYVFFDKGGYVAQAKHYREHAKKTGLFKTLAEKKAGNPNVDLLIGAANIWNWDMKKIELCKELKTAGLERVLFSASEGNGVQQEIEKLGYLAGRYEIFQDVWPPEPLKWAKHDGWPDDLVLLPDGNWMRGWAHHEKQKDGSVKVLDGGVICSSRQLARAKLNVPEDLKTHPYNARFIDTTTASPWRECYNPAHPLTRSDDRNFKMQLLKFISQDCKQVTGTETGIDPSVPYVHYYEGMLSLGPYRLPDAGREMMKKEAATPNLMKFQTGHQYRIPLWELVYHECVVSQWYWGDYNNKVPELWERRDLFNILYGTPPMYMFDKAEWAAKKEKLLKSGQSVCAVARKLGYAEMLEHRFLTDDHAVQMTSWGAGTKVIVNFGEQRYAVSPTLSVEPLNFVMVDDTAK